MASQRKHASIVFSLERQALPWTPSVFPIGKSLCFSQCFCTSCFWMWLPQGSSTPGLWPGTAHSPFRTRLHKWQASAHAQFHLHAWVAATRRCKWSCGHKCACHWTISSPPYQSTKPERLGIPGLSNRFSDFNCLPQTDKCLKTFQLICLSSSFDKFPSNLNGTNNTFERNPQVLAGLHNQNHWERTCF